MSLPARICSPHFVPNLEDYLYIVEAISTNFNRERVDIRDSEIFAYLSYELVSCSTRFNPIKGSFDKYLSSHLFNKAIDFLRGKKRKKNKCFVVPDNYAFIESLCEKEKDESIPTEILSELLADCPEDSERDLADRKLLLEHYLAGKTVVDLAKKYNVTRVSIYNRIKRCIRRIRDNHKELLSNIGENM